jgi:RNA polymerase sigma-70 factor (ECF subfamily)
MNFDDIWTTYERELSAYVLSRVGDKELQKELMQEIALKIFTSLHLQKEHLRGWLYRLTKNTIIDYYRKVSKPLPKLEEEIEVEEHMLLECLQSMINTLKSEEKEILKLSQIEQYSLAEISSMKNLPLNTVKSKLFRAKKSLANNFFSCCTYERNSRGEVVDFVIKDGYGC